MPNPGIGGSNPYSDKLGFSLLDYYCCWTKTQRTVESKRGWRSESTVVNSFVSTPSLSLWHLSMLNIVVIEGASSTNLFYGSVTALLSKSDGEVE
jgi:hypothetical protein